MISTFERCVPSWYPKVLRGEKYASRLTISNDLSELEPDVLEPGTKYEHLSTTLDNATE